MNLLQEFINFLANQKNAPSPLTVKNYRADIGQFISWFEETFSMPFDLSRINSQILYDYKKTRNLSKRSMDRHESSLRKFFSFLETQGNKFENPLRISTASAQTQINADPWKIKNFRSFLYESNKSSLTIKNYTHDIKNFFIWLKQVSPQSSSQETDGDLLRRVNLSTVEEYKERLVTAKFSPTTVNRKLSSLRNYIIWAKNEGFILSRKLNTLSEQPFAGNQQNAKTAKGNLTSSNALDYLVLSERISNIKKEFYAPLSISTRSFPTHKKLWHLIQYSRPNWYKKYHSYSLVHYLHFAMLIIFSCTVGFGLYANLFINTKGDDAALGATDSIIVKGQNLRSYITEVMEGSGFFNSRIISPIVNADHLAANVISPLSSDPLTVKSGSPSASVSNLNNASPSAY